MEARCQLPVATYYRLVRAPVQHFPFGRSLPLRSVFNCWWRAVPFQSSIANEHSLNSAANDCIHRQARSPQLFAVYTHIQMRAAQRKHWPAPGQSIAARKYIHKFIKLNREPGCASRTHTGNTALLKHGTLVCRKQASHNKSSHSAQRGKMRLLFDKPTITKPSVQLNIWPEWKLKQCCGVWLGQITSRH